MYAWVMWLSSWWVAGSSRLMSCHLATCCWGWSARRDLQRCTAFHLVWFSSRLPWSHQTIVCLWSSAGGPPFVVPPCLCQTDRSYRKSTDWDAAWCRFASGCVYCHCRHTSFISKDIVFHSALSYNKQDSTQTFIGAFALLSGGGLSAVLHAVKTILCEWVI